MADSTYRHMAPHAISTRALPREAWRSALLTHELHCRRPSGTTDVGVLPAEAQVRVPGPPQGGVQQGGGAGRQQHTRLDPAGARRLVQSCCLVRCCGQGRESLGSADAARREQQGGLSMGGAP